MWEDHFNALKAKGRRDVQTVDEWEEEKREIDYIERHPYRFMFTRVIQNLNIRFMTSNWCNPIDVD